MASWLSMRVPVSTPAPIISSGIFAPAGTFISVRTERMAETTIDQPAEFGVGFGVFAAHR